ncbi:hypothetical protein BgiMline_035085 [Biomphalaria glabrata]|uniref:Uncharacterized protein LOC106051495 n=1 Tax=Biomphalaria glabrata TaxID=6526 RepID=A0A2C9LNB8_BIOGL|nr:uncharacterized protein LOC106051495 [Biomphalaria glabrata]KAI8736812.1 CAunnamed protein product [Biomphalaria glabrata]
MSFNFMVGMSDYCLEPTPTPTGFSYHHPTIPLSTVTNTSNTMHTHVNAGNNHVNHGHHHNHLDNLTSLPPLGPPGMGPMVGQGGSFNVNNSINGFSYHQEPVVRQEPEAPVIGTAKKKSKKERKRRQIGTSLSRAEIKRRRNAGEEYVTRKGKVVGRKEYEPIDCKCRLNCTLNVTHDMRKLIFDHFHALADWNNQTQFIVSSVTILDIKERKRRLKQEISSSKAKRSSSRLYHLTNKKIRVCKPVFLSALGITNKRLDYALRYKALPITAIATTDFRGKKGPLNKTPADVEERIRAHIKSFPKSSSQGKQGKGAQTLPPDLTISKMYSLYQEQCQAEGLQAASMWVYAKIFNSESKIHLAAPKKEPCKTCERIKIIVHSGNEPDKIIQMLLKEFQERPAQTVNTFMDYNHTDFPSYSQKKN